MKERPILFSGEMVRAILTGNKTQTRRTVKPQPQAGEVWPTDQSHITWDDVRANPLYFAATGCCPYGTRNDQLWVRETFKAYPQDVIYRASLPSGSLACHYKPWKPSIFMPRKLSRITLKITDVRVERVQDISEADANAEGVKGIAGYKTIWQIINGKNSWNENPWVWAITFAVFEVKPLGVGQSRRIA